MFIVIALLIQGVANAHPASAGHEHNGVTISKFCSDGAGADDLATPGSRKNAAGHCASCLVSSAIIIDPIDAGSSSFIAPDIRHQGFPVALSSNIAGRILKPQSHAPPRIS